MPEIIIPNRLQGRLSLDSTWQPVVTTLKEKVQKIIRESPCFFPDYTDHGIDHVNEVLILANRLIPEDTYAAKETDTEFLLDPRSVGFLVCAILIHDLGMFLKTDGMEQLVYGDSGSHLVEGLDEEDWRTSWSKYVVKTRRLKDNEMDHLFGHRVTVSEDCARKGFSTNGDDCRVIGEFLRQNHGRLAHEIAVHGFPGDRGTMLIAGDGITDEDRDMIGLLARSHQMNIRDTEEYIERFGEGSKPHSIPAFYLMTVLRMADYLDASEKRAPEILERIQKIRVPASETEWSWNQCITKGPKQWNLMKHNLEINATPQKSTEYVLLDKWLRSVQAELDLCWSILADQYSGEPYRLTIHRVRSNIQQKKSRKNFDLKFLTREAKITANPAIVKLMMAPLYGDDPTYGVRELLQNAVDACLEREKWEKDHGNPNYKGRVDIRIENDIFTITDNGMGMNENVLLNYYLSAGSSYRSSDAWMAANAPDGKSQVARTGKFGVGFLAAFLLGDEIEVHTQHREDNQGYSFTFSQESTALDVRRKERAEPGTTITIRLKPSAIKNWNNDPEWYNWYAFDDPKVSYTVDGKSVEHGHLRLHRPPADTPGWFRLPSKDFEAYHWKPNLSSMQPEFYCNGIRIYHSFPSSKMEFEPQIYFPHISILDKQGKLAVDLARKKLEGIPMEDALLQDVLRWHIARLLLTPWDSQEDHRQNFTSGFVLCDYDSKGRLPFLLTPVGFQLNHASLISALSVRDYVVLYYEGPDAGAAHSAALDFLQADTPCTIVTGRYSAPAAFADHLLNKRMNLFDSPNTSYRIPDHTCSLWFRPDVPDKLNEISQKLINLDKPSTEAHLLTGRWKGRNSKMPIDPKRFSTQRFPAAFHVVLDLSDSNFCSKDSLFVEMMRDLLIPEPGWPQDLWIPYDMEDRKQKFRWTFDELEVYMKQIRVELELEAHRKAEEAAQIARRRAEAKEQLLRIQALLESATARGDKDAVEHFSFIMNMLKSLSF